MNTYDLKTSLLSININIEDTLKQISTPYTSCDHLGQWLGILTTFYYSRAILRFLVEGDINGFFKDLNREALTYQTLLNAYHNKINVREEDIDGTTYIPLISAIAAGNFDLADKIARLMEGNRGDYDTDCGLAYTAILRYLVIGNNEDIKIAFDKFGQMCKKQEKSSKIIEGLVMEDTDLFNDGLKNYLESFEDLSEEELEEMEPGDEYISVEALAYIQLAKRKGIEVNVAHRMIPTELQDVRLLMPESEYPVWLN
ncbi:MAG: immunity 49 family protein [Desulfamplus sp.]|nr:immunity 49 family protein [Desulfamplus sp.]